MQYLDHIARKAIDLVLPPRCPGCGSIVETADGFCSSCWTSLHFLTPPWCAACALPLPYDSGEEQLCGPCSQKLPPHDGIWAVVAYDDVAGQIPMRLKYGGRIALAMLIAHHLKRHVTQADGDALLTPVPLHRARLWGRGFNQSALIAQALSKITGHHHIPDILIRHKNTQLLRGKNSLQRKKELAGAFTLNTRHSDYIQNKTILLVDDVYTSGATSHQCARLLKKAGAAKVYICCWARVLRDEQLS